VPRFGGVLLLYKQNDNLGGTMQRYDVELKNGEFIDVGAQYVKFEEGGVLAFYDDLPHPSFGLKFVLAYGRNEWKAVNNAGDDAATDDE
jgi:hypothetical protein